MTNELTSESLETLRDYALVADAQLAWPDSSWKALERSGVYGWEIDPSLGGCGLEGVALLHQLERLAGACLTTCFLLSQRQAAVRRIGDHAPEPLRGELLRPLAKGETFATVGLSQLTTSRQYGPPALIARPTADGFVLHGSVPWVTGADRADHFVLGATTESGLQILIVVPAKALGLTVQPPLDLMALRGSMTSELTLSDVHVANRWLLAGPSEKVLISRRGGAGGLETSCLALGLAGAAIDYLHDEAKHRPEIQEAAQRLDAERQSVRLAMHTLAEKGGDADTVANLRTNANALVLRATQAALMTAKGAGFLRDHPAQLWARQALFFLVWSCPRPTVLATLAQLSPIGTS